MLRFLIKKNFFDLWDHLFTTCVTNFGVTVLGFLCFLGIKTVVNASNLLLIVLTILCVVLFSVISLGLFGVANTWSNYKTESFFKSFFEAIKRRHKALFLFFIIFSFIIGSVILFIPFYFRLGNYAGYLFAGILIFASFIFANALMYYFPLCLIRDDKPIVIFKYCIGFVVDNKLFTIALALHNLVLIVLSAITFFAFPSYLGHANSSFIAVKLLLIRYDYMKENKLTKRREIDIFEMLYEENKKVGNRTLRNTIFPWKE